MDVWHDCRKCELESAGMDGGQLGEWLNNGSLLKNGDSRWMYVPWTKKQAEKHQSRL
jgi:hypothetical protein